MSEVSGKTLGIFRKIAERTNGTVEAMFAGSTSPPHPGNDPEYVTWDDFCVLCRNARAACGSDAALAEMGAEVLDLPALGRFVRVIQLCASAKTIYWVNKRWTGPALFNHLDNEFEELENGILRFTITIPSNYADCPEFFHLNSGVMRNAPRIIGLAEAFIEVTITPRKCVYMIDPPPSITLWARLRRAFAVLFSARTAIEELGSQQSLLARRYKELRASRSEIEEARDEAVRARIAAEQALAVRSQFLATMSHELRTPLNGVIGMSELLMGTTLDEEQLEYASTAHRCGETLLQLINDVLDFSKLEAHKLPMNDSVFDVREVVENVLDMLAGQARSQEIELGGSFGELPLWVESDPHRLQQVLVNLVGNAVKFTKKGEVFVSVEELARADDTTTLCFTVRDTGLGMAEEFLPRLFAPFTQADSSNARHFGGTGLGLAICKELVERLGGRIEVESELGVGSVFRFTVQARVAAAPASTGTDDAAIDETQLGPIGRYRALVVDDNPTNRYILAQTLERWGLVVEAVADGFSAAQVLAVRSFDIAILDLRMPGMDGLTLARRIKADVPKPPQLLMLTASGNREDAKAARDLGMTHYMTKPFRRAPLHAAISQLVMVLEPHAEDEGKPPAAPQRPGRVLVVDDNPINRRFASQAVTKLGYEATCATGGREAIELARNEPFDLVFMDCEMPEMDGFDATRALRAMPGRPPPPIIALTAHVTDEIRARCTEAGMSDFLAKPPSLAVLKLVLEKWVRM